MEVHIHPQVHHEKKWKDYLFEFMKIKMIILLLLLFPEIYVSAQQINNSNIKTQKPNIILIVADYMGYADIEPFGSMEIKTPSLKRLALEGIKYTNFYAPAPVCSPSRGALLTKPTGEGTGLGLSLAYDIIKAHGGELKVNTKEGEFTEFVVLLPL